MTETLPEPARASGRTGDGSPLHDVDVAVIGAGVAGLAAAARLRESSARVMIVDKGSSGPGSSPWAQGGIAVAVGADDEPVLHAEDTLRAGDGHCDALAVRTLCEEGPARIQEVVGWGARFDRNPDGTLHLAREGGQSVARSVHAADATGAELMRTLRRVVVPHVSRLVGTAISLRSHDDGRVGGCWVLATDGERHLVRARAVLLATGGCGALFTATTNRQGATGDGLSLASRAGAALRDLEFVQFHPTGLVPASADRLAPRMLLTEALRGAGATLHDDGGDRLLSDRHPDAELAPRHVVTAAIVDAGGRAWLDATGLGRRRLEREFPNVLSAARERGVDLVTDRAPVEPVAHYHIGGVRTDLDARTSLPGLWAAGEVASTGAHGANRMAGNSLIEALVFASRAARDMAARSGTPAGEARPPPALTGVAPSSVAELRRRLRSAVTSGCGPMRDGAGLTAAAAEVSALASEVGGPSADGDHVELTHAMIAAGLIIRAAALRTESRGAHVRRDHPERSPAWDEVRLEMLQR